MTLLTSPLSATAAELDRALPPKAGPLPESLIPEVITETLPNGLRLMVLSDHRQPTVTYRLLVKSGSALDGEKPGLATLTAALLNKGSVASKGSPALSAEEFASKTDFLGASVEAAAGADSTSVIASGLVRDAKEILGFLKAAALSPAFAKRELENEQIKLVAALQQQKSDPSALNQLLANRLLFAPHPYGSAPMPEGVQAITTEDVAAFHKSHFLPNNATLAIVGDLDAKEAIAMAREAFGSWEKGTLPETAAADFPKIKGISVHIVDRPGSVQSDLLVGSRGIPRNNPDLPGLMVVNSVLGGGFSGRLFGNLREKHGYTYGAYSSFGSRRFGGSFLASTQVRNEVTGAAVGEILREIGRMVNEPVPEEELRLQRNYIAGNFLMSLESNRRSAERLQEIDLYGLPEDYFVKFVKQITSVDEAEAARLAKKYFQPENLLIVATGNAREIAPQLEKFGPVTIYNSDLERQPEQ